MIVKEQAVEIFNYWTQYNAIFALNFKKYALRNDGLSPEQEESYLENSSSDSPIFIII